MHYIVCCTPHDFGKESWPDDLHIQYHFMVLSRSNDSMERTCCSHLYVCNPHCICELVQDLAEYIILNSRDVIDSRQINIFTLSIKLNRMVGY